MYRQTVTKFAVAVAKFDQRRHDFVKTAENFADRVTTNGGPPNLDATGSSVASASRPWFDDEQPRRDAIAKHRKSAAYLTLHQSHMSNTDMGLFGGEHGFEKSPRVWVDPDNPLIPHIYTKSLLAANLRYANYGYFKPSLQLTDFDKLVRHARRVPNPRELLTDCVQQRAALNDWNAAAIMRLAYMRMQGMNKAGRQQYFRDNVEQVFERMLLTSLPPIDVGVRTHAMAIRCCALAGRFEEGYNWYRARCVEEADRVVERLGGSAGATAEFAEDDVGDEATSSRLLSADFFDAVLELCIATGRFEQALDELSAGINSGRRLFTTTLDSALMACAYLRRPNEAHQVWRLYEFYDRAPSALTYELLAAAIGRCAAADPTSTAGALSLLPSFLATARAALANAPAQKAASHQQSDRVAQRLTHSTVQWLFHAWATSDVYGRSMGLAVITELAALGSAASPPSSTDLLFALQYCSLRPEDGAETALAICRQYLHATASVTPCFETVLLAVRAFAFSERPPSPEMLQEALRLLAAMRETTADSYAVAVEFRVVDDISRYRTSASYPPVASTDDAATGEAAPFDQMMERKRAADGALSLALMTLASRVGAATESHRLMCRAAAETASGGGDGSRVPSFVFTMNLGALAAAGPTTTVSHDMTLETVELMLSTSAGVLTRELVAALSNTRKSLGPFPAALADLLDEATVENGLVSLLDLVDAHDGYLDLYAEDQPDEVQRVTSVLANLRSDAGLPDTQAATQQWLMDPFTLRPRSVAIFVGANRIGLMTQGQWCPHPSTRESSSLNLQRFRPFGHFDSPPPPRADESS